MLCMETTIHLLFRYCFRYVAPEYANTGLLNEKSDVYSFGVLLLEAVTGRDPIDYGRPANEVSICYCPMHMLSKKSILVAICFTAKQICFGGRRIYTLCLFLVTLTAIVLLHLCVEL